MTLRIQDSRLRARAACLLVTAGLLFFVAASLEASDPPHWKGFELDVNCTSQCHVPHGSLGGGLNPQTGNVNLCQSCHQPGGHADLLPINEADKAQPGVGGIHHGFQVCAVNSDYDTQVPTDTEMSLRLMDDDGDCPDGYVVCSTCHDQHDSESGFGGTPRIGAAKKVFDGGGPPGGGVVTSGGTYTGATGYWYWVEIVDTTPSDKFCWARANDVAVEWCPTGSGCEGCDPDSEVLTPNLDATGTRSLESGVQVTFDEGGGQFADRERWELYAAWPFLRDQLYTGGDSGGNVFCANCHQTWQMTSAGTWDGAVKSHPVGIDLTGDNLHAAPLDGDGSGSDSNPTNDLQLFASEVECLTCHGVHFVDSNTNTVDGPP
jgi:hypothetical protein